MRPWGRGLCGRPSRPPRLEAFRPWQKVLGLWNPVERGSCGEVVVTACFVLSFSRLLGLPWDLLLTFMAFPGTQAMLDLSLQRNLFPGSSQWLQVLCGGSETLIHVASCQKPVGLLQIALSTSGGFSTRMKKCKPTDPVLLCSNPGILVLSVLDLTGLMGPGTEVGRDAKEALSLW